MADKPDVMPESPTAMRFELYTFTDSDVAYLVLFDAAGAAIAKLALTSGNLMSLGVIGLDMQKPAGGQHA